MVFGDILLPHSIEGNDTGCTGTIDDHIDSGATTTEEVVIDALHEKTGNNHEHSQQEVERERLTVGKHIGRNGGLELIVNKIGYPTEDKWHKTGNNNLVDIRHTCMTNNPLICSCEQE